MGLERPLDPKSRIVPADTARCFGMIELRHLIERLGIVFDRQETVGAALGDIQSTVILRSKLSCNPV